MTHPYPALANVVGRCLDDGRRDECGTDQEFGRFSTPNRGSDALVSADHPLSTKSISDFQAANDDIGDPITAGLTSGRHCRGRTVC